MCHRNDSGRYPHLPERAGAVYTVGENIKRIDRKAAINVEHPVFTARSDQQWGAGNMVIGNNA